MNISIKYSLIASKCKLLSEYEAEQAEGGMFTQVVLTDSENELLKEYAQQALQQIEGKLQGVIESVMELEGEEVNEKGETESVAVIEISDALNVVSGARKTGSFIGSICETAAVYCMYMWLLNKLPERSKAYQNMFADLSDATRAIAWKRLKPRMEE